MENQSFEISKPQEEAHKTQHYIKESDKKSNKFLYVIIILLLIGAGVFFGGQRLIGPFYKNLLPSSPSPTATPTPTEEIFPTDTPTPSPKESPTPKETTPTTKPTTNPIDKSTGLDRSDLNVEIKNGSGEVGAASKASEALKTLGYHVSATGNADNFDYQDVSISVKSDKSKYLSLLKKDLGVIYNIGTTSATLSDSSRSDALIIIGK